MTRTGGAFRGGIADGLVVAAMVAVPLASSSAFSDPYTTVKWHLVHALAAAWLLIEVWVYGSAGWPAFVRERRLAVAALALLAAASALRNGPAWALGPLADRTACAVLVLCASWWLARTGGRTAAMTGGLSVSAAVTIAVALAQARAAAAGAAALSAEGPAAFFGNVNMSAQFVGLAVWLVVVAPARGGEARRAAWNALRVALAVSAAVYLSVLAARSVVVALVVAAACFAWGTRRRFLPLAAGVTAVALVAAVFWWQPWARVDPVLVERKASSIDVRLAVWKGTVDLIRDHPLGVGAGNFEHVYPPYHARSPLPPWEAIVFRGPHNEYLRFLAEDGPLFCAVAAWIAVLLVARWRTSPRSREARAIVVGWGAFLAVEALFQFPLALPFGALAASLVVGAMLAEASPAGRQGRWKAGGTLAAALLLAASLRVGRSEYLHVAAPEDAASQRRACALDPRNLPPCVTAAWLEVRDGDTPSARRRLLDVIARTPHYPPALKLLGEIAVLEGDHDEACRRLSAYDALYRGRSSVHESASVACAQAR